MIAQCGHRTCLQTPCTLHSHGVIECRQGSGFPSLRCPSFSHPLIPSRMYLYLASSSLSSLHVESVIKLFSCGLVNTSSNHGVEDVTIDGYSTIGIDSTSPARRIRTPS